MARIIELPQMMDRFNKYVNLDHVRYITITERNDEDVHLFQVEFWYSTPEDVDYLWAEFDTEKEAREFMELVMEK